MFEVAERFERELENFVAAGAVGARDKPNATRIMFLTRIVQADWSPRCVVHTRFLISLQLSVFDFQNDVYCHLGNVHSYVY